METLVSQVRTFLIADVRGYTQFTLEHGDEAAARLASRFATITREVVATHGGHVVELRGDEALVVFASTRQALRAAVDLQVRFGAGDGSDPLPRLPVGIGLDAGEAVEVEGGYRGAALNLAARLCSQARAGEVLCTEGVVHLAGRIDGLNYRPRRALELKGFAEPILAVEVRSTDPRVPVSPTVTSPRGMEQHLPVGGFLGSLPSGPLVARERELTQSLEAVDETARGEGRTLLFFGEPGAGKTRLAQEVTRDLHQRGFLIAAGRCYEPEQSVPYYPFLDVLAVVYALAPPAIQRLAGHRWPYLGALLADQIGVPEVGGGHDDQQRVFRAVTSFLEAVAESTPLAVLLDDLHWADSTSLRLLLHLAQHTRDSRIVILGTYRDIDVNHLPALEGALRDLDREKLVTWIEVRGLPLAGTAALVAATIGEEDVSEEFAHLVHSRTEGNAYFIQQVIRVLMERGDVYRRDGKWGRRDIADIEVPESVRSVVGNRLMRLSERTQESLQRASVLGQSFYFDDLLAMVDLAEDELEDALEEACSAGLLHTADGEAYGFDHGLTQQSLYNQLSPRRRRRLHLAAGHALEQLPERQRQHRVAELAWHYLQGDDAERALLFSAQAGDRAEAVFAHGDAEAQYRVALELARQSHEERAEAEVLQKLGQALRLSGRYAAALEPLEQAAALNHRLGDREGELGAVAQIGRIHGHLGTADEGIGRVLPVVEALEAERGDHLSPACAARLYVALAGLYFRSGKWQDLLRVAEQAVRLAEEAGDDRLLAEADVERSRALSLTGQEDEARQAVARAVTLAEAAGDLSTLRWALNNLAFLQRRAGQLAPAADSYRRALDVAERLGDPHNLAFAHFVLGRTCIERGDWSEAREHLEDSLKIAQSAGSSWYTSYSLAGLGYLNLLEGQRDQGLRYLNEAVDIAERNEDVQGLIIHGLLAQQDVHEGRPEEAIARLERVRERTRQAGREVPQWELGWALLAAGQVEQAADHLQGIGEHNLFEGRVEMPDLLRVLAMLARRQERWADAERSLEDGLTLAREIGMPYTEALLLQEYSHLHVARGQPKAARACLQDALAVFRRLGANPHVEQAAQALAQLPSNGAPG